MARPHAPQDYATTSRVRPGPIVEVRAGPTAPCERSSSLLTMQRGRGDLVCGWRPRACLPLSSMRRGTRVPRPPSTSDLHYEPRSSASKRSASTGGSHEPPSPLNENAQCAGQRIREHAPKSPQASIRRRLDSDCCPVQLRLLTTASLCDRPRRELPRKLGALNAGRHWSLCANRRAVTTWFVSLCGARSAGLPRRAGRRWCVLGGARTPAIGGCTRRSVRQGASEGRA